MFILAPFVIPAEAESRIILNRLDSVFTGMTH